MRFYTIPNHLVWTFISILLASVAGAQGSTRVVSRSSEGEPANTYCFERPRVSDDGRYVIYSTYADNLVPGDVGGWSDVFRTDMTTGRTERVSVSASGVEGDQPSYESWLSSDGRYVLMQSYASNIIPGLNNTTQVVIWKDVVTGAVELESMTSSGNAPNADSSGASMSQDMRYVVFASEASDIVPGDVNMASDVFLRDRTLGTTIRISNSPGQVVDTASNDPGISRDGRFVVFASRASDLVPGDTNGVADVFLYEIATGLVSQVSRPSLTTQGNAESFAPSISADGRYIAFRTFANNFIATDSNDEDDILVLDRQTGIFELASVSAAGVQNNALIYNAEISADGRYVVFNTPASNLVSGDANANPNTFLRDRVLGTTECIDVGPDGLPVGFGGDNFGGLSANGRFVAFRCLDASITVNPATSPSGMVLLRDRVGCESTIATYCTAPPTSHGCLPSIAGSGTPSATAGAGFTISVSGVEGQSPGICFYGISGPSAIPFGGGASVLCVKSPLQRTPVQNSGGTVGLCDGHFAIDWNAFIAGQAGVLGGLFVGGETVWAQQWFRDALAPGGANLSDAIWFTVCR